MTHDEMIEVIQAHKEGKSIQWRLAGRGAWTDTGKPNWNFDSKQYRVKPEPMTIWVNRYTDFMPNHFHHSFDEAEADGKVRDDYIETLKFEQVME